jgi:hypothetical protein
MKPDNLEQLCIGQEVVLRNGDMQDVEAADYCTYWQVTVPDAGLVCGKK